MTTSSLTVPARFNGPPGSGNGGWCAGAVAGHVAGVGGSAVEVRLRKPPPLDTPLEVGEQDGWTVATRDGEVVLQARPGADPEPLPAVGPEAARTAAAAYDGFASHPFGHCFSCGPERADGDGLRIFPGPVEQGLVAAPWTPHPDHTTLEATWAAIDCAGAWAAGIGERAMVLGSMTAQVLALPEAGVEHVVTGAVRSVEGRKHRTATTLRTADGEVLAAAEQVWFEIDPATFG
ncbi:hypothetical protein [Nocardioides abyssi]|uniref:Thioesterase family protein n=1 Tax=Nocardioides abyssi TaxID=3058370 RepID=A0ABT8EP05_9ACTN|nr:hypothetical protein [Nocardioides abyssi]MDN4159887.1 hypothetical protein [Nocardioides abyssi]